MTSLHVPAPATRPHAQRRLTGWSPVTTRFPLAENTVRQIGHLLGKPSCFLLFRPVSGCYGSKMEADSARCVRLEPALGARCPPGQRIVYSDFPLAACPFKRNVLGNSPSPQILND